MDLNDVARFIDRGMDEPERERAVAGFSASHADAELLADAGWMLRDLEAEDGIVHAVLADGEEAADGVVVADAEDASPAGGGTGATHSDPGVIPLRPPSTERARPRRVPVRWLALAAMLAGVLLVPLALFRSGGRGEAGGDYAALLANRQAGLSAGWTDDRPWSLKRGGGGFIEDALAARLGALNTDLALAVAGGQAEQTGLLARQIEAMVGDSDIPASGIAAAPYRQIAARAGEPAAALAPLLAQGRGNIASVVEGDAFALGAWTEAARIAASQRDAGFFRARESRRMLDRAADLDSLDDPTRAGVDALRAASRADGEPDWAALGRAADQLLKHLAG